jgi:hypothetical protein
LTTPVVWTLTNIIHNCVNDLKKILNDSFFKNVLF